MEHVAPTVTGLLWIAMELVQGTALNHWIRDHGSMPLEQLVPFLRPPRTIRPRLRRPGRLVDHRRAGDRATNTPEISPDIAGWRRERMPELPVDEPIRVVPDWVCEILAKTTRRPDLLVGCPTTPRSVSPTRGASIWKRVC
jgi:hypothetical protein